MADIGVHKVAMDKEQSEVINDTVKTIGAHTRTGQRKNLWMSLRRTNDIAFGLAFFGFILMLFDAEMTFDAYYEEGGVASNCVKTFITISTLALVFFIVKYHKLDIQLDMLTNHIQKKVWL